MIMRSFWRLVTLVSGYNKYEVKYLVRDYIEVVLGGM